MGYNSIMNKQIKNLFDKEDIDLLSGIIESEIAKRELFVWDEMSGASFPQKEVDGPGYIIQNVSLGKVFFDLMVPESIGNKLVSTAKDFGFDAAYFRATYTEYSKKYGKPTLNPHTDKKDFLLIDYQLDANAEWELFIEDEHYNLSNNDALIFLPFRMTHGRIEKEFIDDEYVKMIFFYLTLNGEQ